MRPRVYLPAAAVNNDYCLEAAKSHHLGKVLRLSEGAQIILFDGAGRSYTATISRIHRQHVYVHCDAARPPEPPRQRAVHVGQAICASAKMDWAVEKITELGGDTLTPLLSVGGHRRNLKDERWQRLAIAACEQCGRDTIPSIGAAQTLKDWLAALPARSERILLSPRAPHHLATVLQGLPAASDIVLASGPESGFTDDEETLLQDGGFQAANLGAYILRAETAALVALAILNADGV